VWEGYEKSQRVRVQSEREVSDIMCGKCARSLRYNMRELNENSQIVCVGNVREILVCMRGKCALCLRYCE